MLDASKVIKGYTICVKHGRLNGEDCHGYHQWKDDHYEIEKINDYSKECPYNGCETGCLKTLKKDVLFLLKEQAELLKEKEAVEPVFVSNDPKVIGHFHCGNCHTTFGLSQYRYCPWCGRSVKWE